MWVYRQVDFRFCNGPSAVNPFFAPYPLPGSCFCTGSALGCRLMVSEKEGAGPISYGGVAGLAPSTTERKCGLTQSIVPADTVNVSKGKIGF